MPGRLRELEERVGEAMYADQPRLRRRLKKASRSGGPELDRAARAIETSVRKARARAASPSSIQYPPELPVSERRDEIAEAVAANQVVVLCGETGSGKTTQLPKICLDLGRGARGLIGHTQPRRIAARATAARIASELGEPPGRHVGFKIRFSDHTGPDCRVKLMTDGILLAEIPNDRWLRRYDTLIIDEAHERSLNIDFLLGYLKHLLPRRPELKLIVTSATIDPARLAAHFGDAPVIEVSGRTYPVETRYRPVQTEDENVEAPGQIGAILDAVDELCQQPGQGDLLVFLAGEREIRETANALRRHHPDGVEVLPLFARLSAAEQDRVFRPAGRRRIVLATNIAETSLTVPGIRFVIDPGRARISRYSYRSKIQRLQIEAISRASADQRKGRCGRERDGICIRLYDETDFEARPAFTDPEILRTNLASVILQMEALRLGHIEDFPFVDPPDPRFVRDGYRLLRELGAVGDDQRVTEAGRRIASLPVDPRLGRILLAAAESGCLSSVLPIVAMLSIQDPRERPLEQAEAADERHARWQVEGSDFLGILKLWRDYLAQRHHLSVNKQRRWCRENFLSFLRMREWYDVHQQLSQQMTQMGMGPGRGRVESESDGEIESESVHRALLAGFLGHIGRRDEAGAYRGPRDSRFRISPGSVLRDGKSPWLMAASLIQTTRVYARVAARIEPDWIESAAAHLVRRQYDDPRWSEKRGTVVARETVTLYGLVLASGRSVDFSRIDPEAARGIFLGDGLAAEAHAIRAPFVHHNRALRERLEDLEARIRRRDLLADRHSIGAFFGARVPAGICSLRDFEAWRKEAEARDPRCLFMALDDLTASDVPALDPDDFPDSIRVEGNSLQLVYRYEPGADDDGVTVVVPRELLGMLSEADLEWLVPGLLEEKLIAMVRGLPKSLRRRLVPVPETAARCLPALLAGQGERLAACLAAALQREAAVPVPIETLQSVPLPDYLRFNIRVLEVDGECCGESRDLETLQAQLAPAGPVARPDKDTRAPGPSAEWTFGVLPRTAEIIQDGHPRHLFPGLHDEGDGASLAYYASEEQALAEHRSGVLRLMRLAAAREEKYLRRELTRHRSLSLNPDLGVDGGDLIEDMVSLAAEQAFLPEGTEAPRDEPGFQDRVSSGRPGLVGAGTELAALVAEVLERWRRARTRLQDIGDSSATAAAVRDLEVQLDGLVHPGFLRHTPPRWLRHCPRFLDAVHVRLDKLDDGDRRDATLTETVKPFQTRLLERLAGTDSQPMTPALMEYRWMLEELRVSLFAQTLRTSIKISPKRLERQWEQVVAG